MKKITSVVIMFLGVFLAGGILSASPHHTGYEKALKYYNSKRYKEAVSLFKEHVKKDPNPAVYYRIGYALYELKKFDEAAENFKEAYLIDPSFSPETIGLTKEQVEKVKALIKKP
jgi:TolA-binding protein